MKKRTTQPSWLLLYLLVGITVGIFLAERKVLLSRVDDHWIELGLVFVVFSLVAVWLKTNESALIQEDWNKYKKRSSLCTEDDLKTEHEKKVPINQWHKLYTQDTPNKGISSTARVHSLVAFIIALFRIQD